MKNLEQVRAANAWKETRGKQVFQGAEGGEVAKKIPAMILTNGFLAAAAFAHQKGEDWSAAFDAIARHLRSPEVGLVKAQTVDEMIGELCAADSEKLRLVTAEVMAFLNYFRRFARKESED